MLDRQVLQIQPEQEPNKSAHPFSSYLATPNLIVLGDPGAGKTELFRQSAGATDGHFITVRDFLNTPVDVLPRDKWLWIDGLDEARSGRGDKGTIDRLIRKLYEVRPRALRLSCRVADWLGTSDLKALASYFDHQGGAPAVVQLLPLTRDEQREILTARQRTDPDRFIDEAEHRGLEAMLSNPQTLLMLHEVVQDQAWPATRYELFENATALLLREHNSEHNERDDPATQLPLAMVSDAAGALCALRLISECAGFSLQPDGTKDMPGWREIPLAEPVAIRAALNRRVFVSAGIPDAVDYLHRTVAEYLGAGWIAGKIAAGLPLGRVQALLGMDGKPASSLRGLHAWLAVRSPQSAPVLIDADPMGIVMYADAAQLGPADKRRLLTALSNTAEDDPWFYHGNYAAYGVGSLSDPGMVDAFRDLLRAAEAPFALRKLVVDAVAMGSPLPALREDLHALLIDARQSFALRDGALDALLAMGDAGHSAVLSAYPLLGEDENGLRLRCIALRTLYGNGLAADDLVALVAATLSLQPHLQVGMTFRLIDGVPASDAPSLLDRLDFTGVMPERGYCFRKTRDLVRVYEGLLVKALTIQPRPSTQNLNSWLSILLRYSHEYHLDGQLVRTLAQDSEAAHAIVDAWVLHCEIGTEWPEQWFDFQNKFKDCFSAERIVRHILSKMSDLSPERKSFHYRHVLTECFSDPERWQDVFQEAFDRAEFDPALLPVRNNCCVCQVHPWRYKRRKDKKKAERKIASQRHSLIRDFDKHREEIRTAEHLGWLAFIGECYFGHMDDQQPDPIARLKERLGLERAEIALSALKTLVKKMRAPALTEVISLRAENSGWPWWYAVLAGLDLLTAADMEETEFHDDFLQAAIAIECLYPVFQHSANSQSEWEHRWLFHLIESRPDLASSTYSSIIEAELSSGEQYPHGLDELKNSMLAGPDRAAHIERILRTFPHMHHDALEKMLRIARMDGMWPKLQAATEAGVATDNSRVRNETRSLWLAFGFLNEPERYRAQLESLEDDTARDMVWPLLKIGSLDFHRDIDFGTYDTSQLEYVVTHAARFYPYTSPPTGVIHGRENPWDVSRAIGNALATLSSSTDDAAHAALQRLATHPALVSYASQVRHLLAQQRMRRIDAAHVTPVWRSAAQTLLNLAPASAQDLHALVMDHIQSIRQQVAHENTDIYKLFWNEDAYGRLDRPKPENSARDALIELLRPRLQPLGLRAEPEVEMAHDKRADIIVLGRDIKCPIELKRDHHPDVWTAAERQLDRFYTPDPQASDYGIYGVFWYGGRRGTSIPAPPAGAPRPRSAADMQRHLDDLLPEPLRAKIAIVVIDVSGEIPFDRRDRDG